MIVCAQLQVAKAEALIDMMLSRRAAAFGVPLQPRQSVQVA